MGNGYLLAIDQGTTNTKALLVDKTGACVFRVSAAVSLLQPRPGFVEQDPEELWRSVQQVIGDCVKHAAEAKEPVAGIAISNQRETAVAWRVGPGVEAVGNAISWQCRRSSEICERLSERHELIRAVTGLPVDPLASAGKWRWMVEQSPEMGAAAYRGEVRFGNVDAWLLAKLTGGAEHLTDHTNASRTALFDLRMSRWSDEVLGVFGLPAEALPEVRESASEFGRCTTIAELAGVPVVAMIGDSHAAMFGHGGYEPGAVKATYGTGSSLMMLTNGLVADSRELARTVAWSTSNGLQFALEGNIAMTGAAVNWVGDFLSLADPVADAVALANSVPDAAGLMFVPAMLGLGAPYWDSNARGMIGSLGRSHKAAHLARAAVDAIAYQVADVFFAMMKAAQTPARELHADGGATANSVLMQMQADVIGRPVLRSSNPELSALGAAWLGGVTLGWWTLDELGRRQHPTERFDAAMPAAERDELYGRWQTAVARARLTGAAA